MKGVDDHDKEDPPQGGKIREEGQGKEEGSASAEEVHRTAAQVDDSKAGFLLMAKATVPTATVSVVSCKHGTQDVCTVNKIRKYHSMCKMVESVHAAAETQRRIFCQVSRYSISKPNGWS